MPSHSSSWFQSQRCASASLGSIEDEPQRSCRYKYTHPGSQPTASWKAAQFATTLLQLLELFYNFRPSLWVLGSELRVPVGGKHTHKTLLLHHFSRSRRKLCDLLRASSSSCASNGPRLGQQQERPTKAKSEDCKHLISKIWSFEIICSETITYTTMLWCFWYYLWFILLDRSIHLDNVNKHE